MPTGYTASVQSGEITEFSDFVMSCARAFGALINMRDEPTGAEIPERFEPSDYNLKRIDEVKAEKARLLSLSPDQIEAERDAAEAERVTGREEYLSKQKLQRERYEAMLEKVNEWIPPSPDHDEMKSFMQKQLSESIDFDCSHSTFNIEPLPPADEWHSDRVGQAEKDIAYYTQRHREEVARTEGRNEWLRQLRESLN